MIQFPSYPTPEQLAELHLLETAAGADSLLDFIPRVTRQYMRPSHLYPVAKLFSRAEFGPVRACVSVPPRHSKTELILHGIAWWLSRHPDSNVVYVSYGANLANTKSGRAKMLSQMAGVPLANVQRQSEWHTAAGGMVLATGIGGALTGHGANLLIIDDPVKNREEAESATIRDRNWDWFTSTAMTRVMPGGSVIVVHTRWHDDDLIGRIDRELGWEIINLPAIAEPEDALGREVGEPLWPGMWQLKELETRRTEIGEYDWASLFQGQPRPKGGRLFKTPTFYDEPNWAARPLVICDPAATAKTSSDYSAIVVGLGWLDEKTGLPWIDIVEVLRIQVEIPQLVQILYEVQKGWSSPAWNAYVGVEAVGGFKAVPQALRRIDKSLKVFDLKTVADKFTRALGAAAAWNDGRIRLPKRGAPWLKDYVNEIMTFTGVSDVHDDQTDATAHLFNQFVEMLPSKGHGVRPAMGLSFG